MFEGVESYTRCIHKMAKTGFKKVVKVWRHDTQHNDTQHNDTQHNDTQHNNK
jgi:hypothetical protein